MSGSLIGLLIAVALFAPLLAPASPSQQRLDHRLEPPSWQNPCGLDELGRDILSRLLYGARVSMAVSLSVVLLAALVGTVLGVTSGFVGGRVDAVLMRLGDVFLAFPGILLAIALVALLGPALHHLILALVTVSWVSFARLARAQVLKLRVEEFVVAATALGVPSGRILLLHFLPNVLSPLLVHATLAMGGVILAESSLSFLGLGVQPPTASWGAMINMGRGHLLDAPHLAIFPGCAILVTVMVLNYFGDALAELLDPRTRTEAA